MMWHHASWMWRSVVEGVSRKPRSQVAELLATAVGRAGRIDSRGTKCQTIVAGGMMVGRLGPRRIERLTGDGSIGGVGTSSAGNSVVGAASWQWWQCS